MCEPGDTTVVETPRWLWGERHHPENGIAIDSCIADQIVSAWDQGVRTLGSCCGHISDGVPSVVLTQEPDQPEIARRVLPGWQLLQWQLVDVTGSGPKPPGQPGYHSGVLDAWSAAALTLSLFAVLLAVVVLR